MSKLIVPSTTVASLPLEQGQPSVVPSPHSLRLRRRDATVRAAALVCASFMNVGWAQDARASFGLSGPKEWLQGQKRRTAPSLFRPILSARAKLQRSLQLIGEQNGVSPEAADLIRFALLDCTPPTPGSLVDLQSRTGIMVCTYALLLKNAASLLEDDDDRKVGGQDALHQLNRSLMELEDAVDDASAARGSVVERKVGATLAALDTFQRSLETILGMA